MIKTFHLSVQCAIIIYDYNLTKIGINIWPFCFVNNFYDCSSYDTTIWQNFFLNFILRLTKIFNNNRLYILWCVYKKCDRKTTGILIYIHTYFMIIFMFIINEIKENIILYTLFITDLHFLFLKSYEFYSKMKQCRLLISNSAYHTYLYILIPTLPDCFGL